jgi:hypothetical protein
MITADKHYGFGGFIYKKRSAEHSHEVLHRSMLSAWAIPFILHLLLERQIRD